jgi:hypothetical protein
MNAMWGGRPRLQRVSRPAPPDRGIEAGNDY